MPLESHVERHQLVFINPDLAGLFSAYLCRRAGADIAIVDETGKYAIEQETHPRSFPSDGTFHPADVDEMATDAGFPPPVWERVPLLKLHLVDQSIALNADDGPGGLLLAIGQMMPRSRSVWTGWLQEQLRRTDELMSQDSQCRIGNLRKVDTSVAETIRKLGLIEPDTFLALFDTLLILVVGRGVVQLDIEDFPKALAGILTGWHMPARGEQDWRVSLKRRIQREGAIWREVESVESVKSFNGGCVVRSSDGSVLAPKILIYPMDDRYRHPAHMGSAGAIKWENWEGRAKRHAEDKPVLGLVQADQNRPSVNDNFLAYHLRPDMNNAFTASAPVEERFAKSGDRFQTITSRTKFLMLHHLNWNIDEYAPSATHHAGPEIVLPGNAPSASYPEGPLWGDDVYTRLKAADRLSRRIIDRLK